MYGPEYSRGRIADTLPKVPSRNAKATFSQPKVTGHATPFALSPKRATACRDATGYCW
jgi:hypothetical protein